ncbi:MAG: EAL domain-containing protein, partial [Hydrogenothermaceae bacterium]
DTKRKKLENINNLLKEVNDAIIHSTFEEELFEKIADALVNKIGLKLVWIGKEKPDTKEIIPTFYKGEAIDYLKEIKISSREDIPEGQGITGRAYRENKIYINPDSYSSDIMSPWREKLLKYELLSSVAIPITKGSKVEYVLTLYSSEKNFFKEEFLDILYELKKDIEFTLDKIESIKKSIIIGNAINYSKSWVIVTDEEGNITFINDFVSEISGYSKEELIGKNPRIFKSGYTPEFYTELWKKIKSGEPFTGIFVNRAKDGTTFTLEESIYPLKLPGGIVRYVSIGRDITREQQISSELTKLKFYDILTGLYNINGFSFRCNEEIKGDEYICLILVDIANFTDINKIYGFKVGDEVLRLIAEKLRNSFREGDIIGRVGSDEFGILLRGIKNLGSITVILEKLKNSLKSKLVIEGIDIHISVNGGISIYPQDGKTFEELYAKASLAIKEAKKEGSGVIRFYNKDLEETTERVKFAENLVLKAFEKNLFLFFLQPYFKAEDLTLAGFEALIRIKDEDGKIYTPNFFIDYLENSEYIREFESWAVREAIRMSRKFNIPISLNISAKSFSDDTFISKLIDIPEDVSITCEVTERVFSKEFEKIKKFIESITNKKNIKIAIDDFGTGYSSLNYIKELPADILKVDMSFVRTMLDNERDKALVKTIIDIAKNLGLESLAEGVENHEQYEMLKNMGCDYVQGFLFGKPMPEEEAEKLMKS